MAVGLLAAALGAATSGSSDAALRFRAGGDGGWSVEFSASEHIVDGGRPAALTLRFGEVAAGDHGADCEVDSVPAMFADTQGAGGLWRLMPRRPLRAGRFYTACVQYLESGEERRQVVSFEVPRESEQIGSRSAAPRVVDAWPGTLQPPATATDAIAEAQLAGSVPANLLRLYVWFDQPMRPREVAEHLELRADDGRVLADALVAIPEGLWDPGRRRLTIFLHPGRIKRGVGPRETLGGAVREGTRATLHLLPGLRSAAGALTEEEAVVHLVVGPADRRRPEPLHWRVTTVPAGGRAPLTILFDEPLDREITRRLVRLEHAGELVAGTVSPSGDGRRVQFLPERPWLPGHYRWLISKRVEDLAGNSVDRPFDLDTATTPDADATVVEPSDSSWIELPFEIRP